MRSAKLGLAAALFVLFAAGQAMASSKLGPMADAPVLDQAGKRVNLKSLVGSGSAIIVFYKGHW